MCEVTILMTVKNGERHLPECMTSVLNQSFRDYEFLIFDDASSDGTLNLLKSYEDDRIKIITDTTGYVDNLNRGIHMAKGKYIARMDHDDIMFTQKIETQYALMETNGIEVCGTSVYLFGESFGKPSLQIFASGFVQDPIDALSKFNYIHHSTIMLNRDFILKNNLKYEDYFPADDYKFWFEIAKKGGRFYMEPEPLLYYRLWPGQSGTVYSSDSSRLASLVQKEINEYLNLNSL